MEKLIKNKKIAIALSLFAMLLWALAIPLVKSTYSYLNIGQDDTGSKILVAGLRFFMAGLLAFFYYFVYNIGKKKDKRKTKLDPKLVIGLALTQTFMQYYFYYIGLSNTEGAKASIIQASNAFMTVLIACLLIKEEKLTLRKVVSLIIATAGIVIMNIDKTNDFSFKLRGEGFLIIATIFGSLANVLVRKYGKDMDPFKLTASQFTLGSLPLIAIGIFTRKFAFALDFKLFLFLLGGAFISATAFSIWTMVLKFHQASEFSIYKLFIPIFGTITSVILLGESFTLKIFISLVLVLSGSLFLNKKTKKVSD